MAQKLCETVRFNMHTMRGVVFSISVNLFDNSMTLLKIELKYHHYLLINISINISLNYLLVKDKDIHLIIKMTKSQEKSII